MKNNLIKFTLIILLFIISLPSSAKREPVFYIEKVVYDMGTISQSEHFKSITIPFKNKGKKKLVIVQVKAGCDCTIVDYPKDFIAPGKSSELVITLDATKIYPHATEKHVTIFTNTKNSPVVLTIKAKIVE